MTVDTRIRMAHISVGDRERRLVNDVLDSGRLAQGPMVEALESRIASTVETRHAVAVSSGTAALLVALQALGIGPGDEVVIPALTFGATLNAVIATGAVARVADVGTTYNAESEAFASAITHSTAALLPVHLYGLPADMPAIAGLADRHGLAIVEDAAQALSARVAGRPVGSWGVGCFSLYATKNIMAGEGGVVTTDDETVAHRARQLRNQGMSGRYEYARPGLNWRMSELHAAVGVGQMERLAEINADRRANAERLSEGLAAIPWLVTPETPPGRSHVFHHYTVRVLPDAPVTRDALAAWLDRNGIESTVVYPEPVHAAACFRSHPLVAADPSPNAERMSRSVLSLPVHPGLADRDIDRIVETVARAGGAG